MPTIQKNVLYNYLGQFYIAFIGILILPLYLKYMGAEEYGLIGFFTLLQAWTRLLDLGLMPTLAREVARLRNKSPAAHQLRSIVRTLETMFVLMALLIGSAIFFSRHWLADKWLTVQHIDKDLVALCIGLMAIMISIRWLAALHRSGVNAYEEQVWMNLTDIVLTTLRFPGSLLLIIWTSGNILWFFAYQVILILIELALISRKFYQLLPVVPAKVSLFSKVEAKRIAPFALGIAYTGGIWIFASQLDKLLLSKVLPLSEYGYFTLVATIAGGIGVFSGPISKAVLPRMMSLLANDRGAEMLVLYRKASRLVTCMVAPITLVLALFSRHIIYIWTGDSVAAEWTRQVLPLFVIGNGLLAILAFQYYLQYVHGKLKLHVIYHTAYLIVVGPLVFFSVFNYGAVGAGVVWIGAQLFTLVVWMAIIHRVYAPGIHLQWLFRDILPPIFVSIGLISLCVFTLDGRFPENRFYGLVICAALTLGTTATTLLIGFRADILEKIRA